MNIWGVLRQINIAQLLCFAAYFKKFISFNKKEMKLNQLTQLLGAISDTLPPTAFCQIHKLINKMDPQLIYDNPMLSAYACTTLYIETQRVSNTSNKQLFSDRLKLQSLLHNIKQQDHPQLIRRIKIIAQVWPQCPANLQKKFTLLDRAGSSYQKYKKVCKQVGQKCGIRADINKSLLDIFWMLDGWGKIRFPERGGEWGADTIVELLYGGYVKRVNKNQLRSILNKEFRELLQQDQKTNEQILIKYQFNISNKSNDSSSPPKAHLLSHKQEQLLQATTLFGDLLSELCLNTDFLQSDAYFQQLISNAIRSDNESLRKIEQIRGKLKELLREVGQFGGQEECYWCIIEGNDDSGENKEQKEEDRIEEQAVDGESIQNVEQQKSPVLSRLSLLEAHHLDLDHKKNQSPSSSSNNRSQSYFITPSNLFREINLSENKKKYNHFFGGLSITKKALKGMRKEEQIEDRQNSREGQIRLELLGWIRRCIESVTDIELSLLKEYFEHFNKDISYSCFLKLLNEKYSNLIEKYTGKCKDFNNRKTQLYKFFTFFLLLTAEFFQKQDDLLLLFDYHKNLMAYIALTANIFNFCYFPHQVPYFHSHQNTILMNYQPDYFAYCRLFDIDLIEGFKPINWVGRNIKLPPLVNDYLFFLQGTILLRDIFEQPSLFHKLLYSDKCPEEEESAKNEQVTYQKTLRRLNEHFFLEFYQISKQIFQSESQIHLYYPLLNSLMDSIMEIMPKVGYEVLIYLILLMGLAFEEQKNLQFIQKVIAKYYQWSKMTNKKLYYRKDVLPDLLQEVYQQPITLLVYYNQIFIPLMRQRSAKSPQTSDLQKIHLSPVPLKNFFYQKSIHLKITLNSKVNPNHKFELTDNHSDLQDHHQHSEKPRSFHKSSQTISYEMKEKRKESGDCLHNNIFKYLFNNTGNAELFKFLKPEEIGLMWMEKMSLGSQ